MTRRGLRAPHAETPKLRRMLPGMPDAKITAKLLDVSSSQLQIFHVPGEKSHSSTARQPQHRAGFTVITAKQNLKSP